MNRFISEKNTVCEKMFNLKRKLEITLLIAGIVVLNLIAFRYGYIIYNNLKTNLQENSKAELLLELKRIQEIVNNQYLMIEDNIRMLSDLLTLEEPEDNLQGNPAKLPHFRKHIIILQKII